MTTDGLDDTTVAALLLRIRRIALLGASDRPQRPSHGVMRFLLDRGFGVTPVNPQLVGTTIHGETVVASLGEARPIEMVDVFRASQFVSAVADEAIAVGASVLWLQLGVTDPGAEARARAAGLMVVVDRCPVIEWHRLGLPSSRPAPTLPPPRFEPHGSAH